MFTNTTKWWIQLIATICAALLVPGDVPLLAQQPPPDPPQQPGAAQTETKLPPEQLESLVAPIALYPDPLLAQCLAASTYPLELVQAQQWLAKNPNLKDKALADAVQKQDWDPSVQAMVGLPDVLKRLTENITWTVDLGNAFLAQQNDVMEAVQRLRAKAMNTGKLQSAEQMKVETKVVESKQVVVIQQAKPEVVYVPSYDPVVVFGAAPVYPYPPVTYPPPGYYAAGMALSFGAGVMMGAMWSGGWGWGCGWGGNNNVNVNVNNNFNRVNNIRGGNTTIGSGNRATQWDHNPQHRGGAPYGDRNTANRFSGTTRGDSLGNRQASARSNLSPRAGTTERGGNFAANRGASGGLGDRGGSRGGGPSVSDRSRGGGDRVGNRSTSGGGGGAFGGGSRSSASSSRSRGSSSFGGSRGGGRRR